MSQYCTSDEEVARALVAQLNTIADGMMASMSRLPTDYLKGKLADAAGMTRGVAREIKEDLDGKAKDTD